MSRGVTGYLCAACASVSTRNFALAFSLTLQAGRHGSRAVVSPALLLAGRSNCLERAHVGETRRRGERASVRCQPARGEGSIVRFARVSLWFLFTQLQRQILKTLSMQKELLDMYVQLRTRVYALEDRQDGIIGLNEGLLSMVQKIQTRTEKLVSLVERSLSLPSVVVMAAAE